MGGKNSVPGQQGQAPGVVSQVSDLSGDKIRRGFRQYANSENKLSRPKFHEALELLEDLGLRRLRDTPLGDRLFTTFDTDRSGFVEEEEFVRGVAVLVGDDQRKKIDLTFQAYDSSRGGVVTRAEFLDILTQSWTAAFKCLAEALKKQQAQAASGSGSRAGRAPAGPSPKEVLDFAVRNLPKFRQAAERQFEQHDVLRQGNLDRQMFGQWASVDRTVTAKFGDVSVQVAVTFMNIEKPAAYPDIQNMPPPQLQQGTGVAAAYRF